MALSGVWIVVQLGTGLLLIATCSYVEILHDQCYGTYPMYYIHVPHRTRSFRLFGAGIWGYVIKWHVQVSPLGMSGDQTCGIRN